MMHLRSLSPARVCRSHAHTHTHHPHTHRHVTFARTDTATEPLTWYTLSFDGDGQRESL